MEGSGKDKRKKRRRGRGRTRDRGALAPALFVVAEVALVGAMIAAPLMLGSVHRWSVATGLVLALVAFVSVALARAAKGKAIPVHPVAVGLGAVVLFEALQIVPLPPGMLAIVSPRAFEIQELSLGAAGLWPSWRPLSLDPVGTGITVARHGSWLLLLLTASVLARDPRRAGRLLVALGASVAVVTALAFTHKLAGLEQIYGLYPTKPGGWLFASFINPNHFAAYLDLLAPVCLALALAERSRSKKALWGLIFVLAGATCLLTLSRGGIVALVAGLTWLVLLRRLRAARASSGLGAVDGEQIGPIPSGKDAWQRLRVAAGIVGPPLLVGLTLAVGAYLALDPILSEVSTLFDQSAMADEVRWSIWSGSLPLIKDFWAVGVGAGAFAVTYPLYKAIPGHVTFSHAENQLVQVGAELGLIVAVFSVAILIWGWLSAVRKKDLPVAQLGLLAGLAGLAVHEMTDFSTAFGGVAVPASIALGILLAQRRQGSGGRVRAKGESAGRGKSRLRMIGLPGAHMVAVFVLLVGGMGLLRSIGSSPDEMLAKVVEGSETGGAVDDLARDALKLRPSDHMPALVASRAAIERGDAAAAMRWINIALYLAPTESRAHLLAAEILARAGREDQALLQYRLAAEWGEPSSRVLTLVHVRYPALDQLARALPDDSERRRAIVRFLSSRGRHEDAWTFGAFALELEPEDCDLMALHANTALRLRMYREAEELGRALVRARPRDRGGYSIEARSRLATGRLDEARSSLEEGLRAMPADSALSMQLAHALIHRGKDPDAGLEVIEGMRLPTTDRARARMHSLRADAHAAKGRTRQAMDEYRTAARLRPDDPGPWISMGDYSMAGGQFERALEAYLEARRRSRPGNTRLEERIARATERVEALEAYRTRERLLGDGDVALPVRGSSR